MGAEATFGDARALMTAPEITPIPLIYSGFTLAIREVAAAEERGSLLDLDAPAKAAIACSRLEDSLIFNGNADWKEACYPINPAACWSVVQESALRPHLTGHQSFHPLQPLRPFVVLCGYERKVYPLPFQLLAEHDHEGAGARLEAAADIVGEVYPTGR